VKALIFWLQIAAILLSIYSTAVAQTQLGNCAQWTGADWNAFIDNAIEDTFTNKKGMTDVYTNLQVVRASCETPQNSQRIEKCLDRFTHYSKHFDPLSSGHYSSIMTDEEYLASLPKKIMRLPPEFANEPNALPKNWQEIAEKNSWKWVHFSSGTASEARLIILVPGKIYDRLYLYYNYDPKNTDPTTYTGVQMQAVEKNSVDPATFYFKAWVFKGPKRIAKDGPTEARCLNCHLNGPRAIVESKYAFFPIQLGGVTSVNEFNKLIISPKPLNYERYYNLDYFPAHMQLGSTHQCTECHNGNQRSSLAFSVDEFGKFNFSNIIRKVAIDQTMPKNPWWEWSPISRDTAYSEIQEEYNTKLKDWITEMKCDE
jgi:hypothetical protein